MCNLETKKALSAHAQALADNLAATRDWAGFFAALAAFAKEVLPIILPLIVTTTPPAA